MLGSTNERGASLLETAILLPMLLALVVGIIDFSRVMNAYLGITRVAYEATRSAGSLSDLVYTSGTGVVTDDRVGCPISEGTLIGNSQVKKCPLSNASFTDHSGDPYRNRVARLIYEMNGENFPTIAGWTATVVDLDPDPEVTQRAITLKIAISFDAIAARAIPYGGYAQNIILTTTVSGPFLAPDPET